MGVFGMMRTSLSGMNAQSDRLSAVADNVANASTIGYKKAITQFSDLVINQGFNGYQSGGVQTHTRFDVGTGGGMRNTGDAQDLSIQGNGFFLVTDKADGTGSVVLTRAGDFRPDKHGNLRNSAGYYLLSRDDSHAIVNVGNSGDLLQKSEATKNLNLQGNLPFNQKSVKHEPFDPQDPDSYSHKTSCTVTGSHGESVVVDVYFVKTDKGWSLYVPTTITVGKEVTKDDFKPNGLPLNFDAHTGDLTQDVLGSVIVHENAADTKGSQIDFKVDKSKLRNSGDAYEMTPIADGHADGYFKSYTIDETGHLVLNLTNGKSVSKGQIQVATVEAPSKLLSKSGTVFQRTPDVGVTMIGYPGSGLFGNIENQQLEQSNADIATELTDMIEAQRTYTSNSKVFQTGSELMDAVINMIR